MLHFRWSLRRPREQILENLTQALTGQWFFKFWYFRQYSHTYVLGCEALNVKSTFLSTRASGALESSIFDNFNPLQ